MASVIHGSACEDETCLTEVPLLSAPAAPDGGRAAVIDFDLSARKQSGRLRYRWNAVLCGCSATSARSQVPGFVHSIASGGRAQALTAAAARRFGVRQGHCRQPRFLARVIRDPTRQFLAFSFLSYVYCHITFDPSSPRACTPTLASILLTSHDPELLAGRRWLTCVIRVMPFSTPSCLSILRARPRGSPQRPSTRCETELRSNDDNSETCGRTWQSALHIRDCPRVSSPTEHGTLT